MLGSNENILLVLVSTVGGIYDFKARRIPNWITFGTLVVILLINLFKLNIGGVVNCILGFLMGILLLFIPYYFGGMGAGDVKLLGAIGAIVGFKDIISIFFYSSVVGLALSLIWIFLTPGHLKFLLQTGQILPVVDKKQKLPYGLAIMSGSFIYILLGSYNFSSWLGAFG